jgi:hypothetical protein
VLSVRLYWRFRADVFQRHSKRRNLKGGYFSLRELTILYHLAVIFVGDSVES